MKCQVPVGPAGVLGELAWQEGGGVRGDDGLGGQERGELLVELDLRLGVLRHRLDHEVGVGDGGRHVEFELDAIVGRLCALEAGLLVEGLVGVGDAGAPGGGAGCHALDFVAIGIQQLVDLGLRAADTALAAEPDGDVKSAISRLERNLAAEHATARDNDLLEAHDSP